jgi:hypothetical protein
MLMEEAQPLDAGARDPGCEQTRKDERADLAGTQGRPRKLCFACMAPLCTPGMVGVDDAGWRGYPAFHVATGVSSSSLIGREMAIKALHVLHFAFSLLPSDTCQARVANQTTHQSRSHTHRQWRCSKKIAKPRMYMPLSEPGVQKKRKVKKRKEKNRKK